MFVSNGKSVLMVRLSRCYAKKKLGSYYYKKCVVSKFKRVGLFHNNAHTFKLAKNSESHATMFYKLGPCDSFFLFSECLINPNIHFAHPSKRSLRKSTYRDVVQKLIQRFPPLHCWNIADTV